MKAFTDISQSKKLAEFLPLESADMWYWEFPTAPTYNGYGYPMFHKGEDIRNVPCWSLAALLNVLPKRRNDYNVYMPLVGRYYEGNNKFICGYFGDGLLDYTFGETPVDACYEMIIKLHELNLL